jgi:carbon-monoxide dehydrogenase large subunit
MSNAKQRQESWIGRSVARLDAEKFVTGNIEYAADSAVEDLHHIAVLRSPHARALIRKIDLDACRAIPGVIAAVSGRDVAAITNQTPSRMPRDRFPGPIDIRCLAVDRVQFEGQGVAAVVARTSEIARRALDKIVVDYEVQTPVLSGEEALRPGAPILLPDWQSNVLMRDHFKQGDPDSAFKACAYVVSGEVVAAPSTSAPIETRCYTAIWDRRASRLTINGTFQMPHPSRWSIAEALGLRESQVRVVAPHAGGAFGLKMVGHPEDVLTALLAKLTGKPVRFAESRAECFMARSREQVHRFEIGADADGKVIVYRNRFVADVGAIGAGGGWAMGLVTAAVSTTVYDIPHCEIEGTLAITNKAPWQGIRGYGKETGNLVIERAIDMLAKKMGRDPAELRRINLVSKDQLPRRIPSGMLVDSGDYHAALDRLLELFDYDGWRRRQAKSDSECRIGIGIAFELTPEGGSFAGSLPNGFETTTVRVEPSGEVIVTTSVTSPGGGIETGIAQVVADILGIAPSSIVVRQGDTDACPFGGGNASSRGMMFGGGAAALAARDVRTKLDLCAAVLLQTVPENIVWRDGCAERRDGPGAGIALREVASAIYTQGFTVASGVEMPLEATRSFRPENVRHTPDQFGRTTSYPSFPYAVHGAAIELDTGTAQVRVLDYAAIHDCGVVVNPALVEGQFKGAIAMGIGAALWEELVYDDDGRLVTDCIKRYLLPRSRDIPALRTGSLCTPSPFHPMGMKGAGETGVGGAYAAISNAVADALRDLAPSRTMIPASPPRLARILCDA